MKVISGSQTRYQIGYHMVWGVKYHKHLLNKAMKGFLVDLIKNICVSYDYRFYCIGIATNHVHFFVGAPPKIAPAKIVQTVKSITAREMFKNYPQVKKQLWGGEFWKDGYYVGTVGEGQTETGVIKYIEKQEKNHAEIRSDMKQLKLFY